MLNVFRDRVFLISCMKNQTDWINKSFYDVIHPEDTDKMKDQLATEVSNDTRILDLKSKEIMLIKKFCLCLL